MGAPAFKAPAEYRPWPLVCSMIMLPRTAPARHGECGAMRSTGTKTNAEIANPVVIEIQMVAFSVPDRHVGLGVNNLGLRGWGSCQERNSDGARRRCVSRDHLVNSWIQLFPGPA